MRFATKIFLAVFLTALGLTLGISTALYSFLTTATRSQYLAHYQTVTHQVAATLTQLESTTDLFMASAVRVVNDRVSVGGPPSSEDLLRLRDELGVTQLYILNAQGAFIRSTSENPSALPNAFSFCSRYQHMLEHGEPFQPTGLMPGIPALVPYKFLFLASSDRRYLSEVAVRADFIGRTLQQTVTADPDLISLALYAPNGTSLGEFTPDGRSSYERSLSPSVSFTAGTAMQGSRLQVTERVNASNRECCSCRKRGLIQDGDYHYYLRAVVSTRALDAALRRLTLATGLLICAGLLFSALASRALSRRLVARVHLIDDQTHAIMRTGDLGQRLNLSGSDELARMSATFNEMLGALQIKQQELIRLEKSRAVLEATTNVAHDIRSPLAALDTLLNLMQSLPEDQRVLLRTAVGRIHSISNSLLEQTRRLRASDPGEAPSRTSAASPESLWSLVEPVLSEKRQMHLDRSGVTIEPLNAEQAYRLFITADAAMFQRVLSNLIDNALDAIVETGNVRVLVEQREGQVQIIIQDTGRGIPAELLPTLIGKGRTFGKPGGSGLGLYAARQTVDSWNGDLQITSLVGKGTTVTITLPASQPPAWFVPAIRVHPEATIVVVDDDPSIHEVWRARLSSGRQSPLLHLYTLDEFRQFCTNRLPKQGSILFLMDDEFRGEPGSGLACIAQLEVHRQSILVTSHADELPVREQCIRLGIGLIPKSAAPFVPIQSTESLD